MIRGEQYKKFYCSSLHFSLYPFTPTLMLAFAPSQRPYTYYGSMHGRQPPPSADMGGNFFRDSIRELAQQRARKAQWLPDEVDDSDDELDYNQLGVHERRYLETQRNIERTRNEHECRASAMQEAAERLRHSEEERARKLEKRQIGAQDARQRVAEQMIREGSATRIAALEREAVSVLE
jgi:uncharacterized protein with WD repeat